MRSAFHEDAIAFATVAWDFVQHFIPENRATTTFTIHTISNLDIEVLGDVAFSEAYFVTYVGRKKEARSATMRFADAMSTSGTT